MIKFKSYFGECFKNKSIVLFCLMGFIWLNGHAQDKQPAAPDSLSFSSTDTTDISSIKFVEKISKMYRVLNRVSGSGDKSLDTKDIEQNLPKIDSTLQIIKDNISTTNGNTLNLKNLQMFTIVVQDMMADLREWRTALTDYNTDLLTTSASINEVTKDSVLHDFSMDTSLRRMYASRLKNLKQKWVTADSANRINLNKVDDLQTKVADDFMTAISLRNKIRKKMKAFGTQAIGKEYDYLWQLSPGSVAEPSVQKNYYKERKVMDYYFSNSWDKRLYMLLTGLVFFGWVFFNYRKVRRAKNKAATNFDIIFIRPVPILSSLVVMFTLAPFFDLHPPAVYFESMQFFLLVVLTILIWRTWHRKLSLNWLLILLMFLLFTFNHILVGPGFAARWWLFSLNVASAVFGYFFYTRASKKWSIQGYIRPVTIIYIVLNLLAVVANIFGRLTIAQTLGTTAIFGLTQIVALTIFIQIIVEAFFLQMQSSRLTGGFAAQFNFEDIQKKLLRVLSFVVALLWLIIFTTNLNLYDTIYTNIEMVLRRPWEVGSTKFTLSNIALFFLIIYIANLLQRYLGYFFGETTNELIPDKKNKKGTRLLLTRLILLSVGFMLAVAASGMPLDKITIVLGALGVGIGLGLQSIVNNLVSGIILIFERPLEVGDSIEVSNKKGIVKDIGIRASVIVTPDGAEVIVPNGDLISQHVTNWTLSNNYVRIDIPIKVAAGTHLGTLKDIVAATIQNNEMVMNKIEPSVVLKDINETTVSLHIYFWGNNINEADALKGDIYLKLYDNFNEQGIKML